MLEEHCGRPIRLATCRRSGSQGGSKEPWSASEPRRHIWLVLRGVVVVLFRLTFQLSCQDLIH